MSLSDDQLRARVKERLATFAKFTSQYWEEVNQAERIRDNLAATVPSLNSTAPPNMTSVTLAIAWQMTLKEKGATEFKLRYLPDLLKLRAELLRRGASLPNDQEIMKTSMAASHCLEAGVVPDKEGIAALTQYFNRLADSLI